MRRGSPALSVEALRNGVPLFLAQVSETLRAETGETGSHALCSNDIADGATKHGAELLTGGFTVSEVVHFYGDICQAVTELAVEQNAPVTVNEFRILNRSLDTAIAKSVTEHTRLTAGKAVKGETERIGKLARPAAQSCSHCTGRIHRPQKRNGRGEWLHRSRAGAQSDHPSGLD